MAGRLASWERAHIRHLLLKQCPFCHYCQEDLDEDTATLDHIVPISKGGTNDLKNLTLACELCNRLKDSLDYDEFRQRLHAPYPPSITVKRSTQKPFTNDAEWLRLWQRVRLNDYRALMQAA